MTFPTAFSSSLQVFAAFAVFIAGYLALVICAILCLVIAELYSDRANVVQAYAVKSSLLDASGVPGVSRKALRSDLRTGLIFRK